MKIQSYCNIRGYLLIFAAAFTSLVSIAAVAADTIDEIVVSATRRDTNLQETPIAITAMTGDSMSEAGIRSIRDLALSTPGLTITGFDSQTVPFIRGVGNLNIFIGSDSGTATYYDGVYLARPVGLFATEFIDVERVEVARGPQGTLVGRSATGGSISVYSKLPTDEFEGKAVLGAGDYSYTNAGLTLSGPIADQKVNGRLSIVKSDRDGFFEPDSGSDLQDKDILTARGALHFISSDKVDVILRADFTKNKGTGLVNVAGNPLDFDPAAPVVANRFNTDNNDIFVDQELWGISATVTFDISDNISLKSITAYRESEFERVNDQNGSGITHSAAFIDFFEQVENQEQFTQEFVLSGEQDRFDWVTGVFYYKEDAVEDAGVGFGVQPQPDVFFGFDSITKSESLGIFGLMTFHLSDRVNLIVGGRYSTDDREITSVFPPDPPEVFTFFDEADFDSFTPKLGIDFKVGDDSMMYVSATRGYKSGGFSAGFATPAFDPEDIWNYEVGFKADLMENRVRLNAAAFVMDYTDLQTQIESGQGGGIVLNAKGATISGLEVEFSAVPTDRLDLGLSLALLDTEYDDFDNASNPFDPTMTIDVTGNSLPFAPETTISGFVRYTIPLRGSAEIAMRLDATWRDDIFFNLANSELAEQTDYGLVNARIAYSSSDNKYEVAAWARNLLDEEYAVFGIATATCGTCTLFNLGEPRTYGVELAVNF